MAAADLVSSLACGATVPDLELFTAPGSPPGAYVVYRLDFTGGEHYIGMTTDLQRRLKEHRRRGIGDLQRLLSEDTPEVTILHRCSSRAVANYYEELAIDAAMEAPTRRGLLNTLTP